MNHIAYLKKIRLLHYILLICAVAFTAIGFLMGGVALLVLAFLAVWKYHRCPKCAANINTLLPLDDKCCCPYCGCFLKDGTENPEWAENAKNTQDGEKAEETENTDGAEAPDTETDGTEGASTEKIDTEI